MQCTEQGVRAGGRPTCVRAGLPTPLPPRSCSSVFLLCLRGELFVVLDKEGGVEGGS